VAEEEPVTSPDQHKPGNAKLARLGAVAVIVILLAMLCGNHRGHVEDIFLIVIAALLAVVLIGDLLLRKNGLR
jgi:hypothetical protein